MGPNRYKQYQTMAKRLLVAACLCILSAVESRGGGIHHSSPSHNRMIQSAFSSTSPSLLPSSSYYYTHHTKLSPRCNHQLLRPTTNTFNCISSQSTILLLHKQQRVNAAKISNLYLSSSASPTQEEEEVTPTKKQITATFNSKSNDNDNADDEPIILLIGGSGFLGTEIRKQLKHRDIPYVATATTQKVDARDGEEFVSLDLTASDSEEQFYNLIVATTKQQHGSNNNRKKKVAVISAMGSIGTNQDEKVNAALSRAIRGAYRINKDNYEEEEEDENEKIVERFVMIGNTERVRRLASNLPFLKGYASGKEVSVCYA